MSRSTFTMAAAALAATASAAYSASSTQNVVVYWGQGSNVDLSTVCKDSSIDVVALAFVNKFPTAVGEYPGSNFADSCWQQFPDPKDSTKASKLLNCPNFEAGIKTCHDNGKKVLLSLGGGYPTDYYLPDESVAKYFAGWLLDAFGPLKSGYTGPRPFGNLAVDGFDLDLEADQDKLPSKDLIWKNYAALVNEVKRLQPSTLITAAPQCFVEDPRLADAIKNSHFDMIFTQFYNTPKCSARAGFNELSTGTTEFTFQKWSNWLLANSQNKAVKLYMGLPAGVSGAGADYADHYLKPEEAYQLVSKWKTTSNFGGVMLWSHTVSNNNVNNCKSYSYWMKATLEGSFRSQYSTKACASSSSSVRPSTTSSVRPSSSSVRVSSSSVRVSSSSVRVSSSSARPSSSKVISSSSSVIPSSSKVIVSSSSVIPSSTSGAPIPTATLPTTDGTCGIKADGVAHTCVGFNGGECCSEYGYCGGNENGPNPRSAYCGTGCNPLFGTCDGISSSSAVQSSSAAPSPSSSSVAASSSAVQSSSVAASSSAVQSSSVATSSSAVQSSYVATSSSAVQSSSVAASSSVIHSSSASVSVSSAQSSASASASKHDSSSVVVSSSASVHASSSVYSASTPVVSSSASVDASSSVASSSVHVDSSSLYTTSGVPYPTGGSSVFPSFSSAPYPIYNVSRSHDVPVYPAETPVGPSSTPCSTSSKPVVPTSSSKPSYPEYPASSSKPSYQEYPVISKLVVPSSKPVPGYPESPASSTIKVITTTYVDICETGVTTKTETITKTVCNKCNKPEEDSVTSVYVCNNCGPSAVTVTITKPNVPATGVPAKPTGPSYGGDKPSAPVYGGEKPQTPAQPSGPSYGNDKPNQPVYSVDVKKQNDATSTTVEIVYVTKTPVAAVPSYTPVGYPSGPAKNGTSGYPIQPSGTGVPTKLTGTGVPTKPTYAPPQFTGAASRLGAGLAGVVAIAAGLLVL